MKDRIYLRVAKNRSKFKVAASSKPVREPLFKGSYSSKEFLPTVLIGLDLDIPDREFEATRIMLEANIQHAEAAVELRQVETYEPEERNLDREIQAP